MIRGSCHCGKVRFEAPTPETMVRCNCTYCDRVGALWGYCDPAHFQLHADPVDLTTYAPNIGKHYSCAACGMVTHGLSPDYEADDGSEKASYNIRMDVDFDRSGIQLIDMDGRHQW